MLQERIEREFIEAFKAKDMTKKNTLGILKSRISEWKADKKNTGKEIADDDILGILTSEVKKRVQAIDMYKTNTSDVAQTNMANEIAEKTILETFLPSQMNDVEIMTEILKVKTSLAMGPLVGNVMKHFNTNFKGRYDNKKLQELLKTV
jgi:uncharacterized protein YqeY